MSKSLLSIALIAALSGCATTQAAAPVASEPEVVTPRGGAPMAQVPITPSHLDPAHWPRQLRVGKTVRLEYASPADLDTMWTTSEPKVLESVGMGIFHARAPGHAVACASMDRKRRCTPVEVTP